MEFNRNADVFTKNDNKVGSINRVVIDPKTKEITHMVVEKGFLFTEDRVIPLSLVGPSTEERVVLRVDEDELDELPKFEATFYVPDQVAGEYMNKPTRPQKLILYPPYNFNYKLYGGYTMPPYVTHTERSIPEGTIPLKEGAQVISVDDQKVGKVDSLLTDSVENRITHLVVSQGLIFEERKLIPSFWISMVMEDEIHLLVDEKIIESLPEYEVEAS